MLIKKEIMENIDSYSELLNRVELFFDEWELEDYERDRNTIYRYVLNGRYNDAEREALNILEFFIRYLRDFFDDDRDNEVNIVDIISSLEPIKKEINEILVLIDNCRPKSNNILCVPAA